MNTPEFLPEPYLVEIALNPRQRRGALGPHNRIKSLTNSWSIKTHALPTMLAAHSINQRPGRNLSGRNRRNRILPDTYWNTTADSTRTISGMPAHGASRRFESGGGSRGHTGRSTTMQDQEGSADKPPRIEEHEARLDSLEGWQDMVSNHVMPRIDDLEEQLDDRDTTIEELQDRIRALEAQLEVLGGLADTQQTTPEKRAVDLAVGMIRRAENRSDRRIALYYKEVKDLLTDYGHEGLHDPQAFGAMEDVADCQGFGEIQVQRDGRTVKAVGVNLDELPGDNPVNEIKNEVGAGTASEPAESAVTTSD